MRRLVYLASLIALCLVVGACANPASETGTVETPAFSVAAGTYASDQSVELSDSTNGAAIYYTLDGSAPTKSSNLYSGAIAVKGDGTNVTVKALAVKDGMTDSAIASAAYVISYPPTKVTVETPAFSLAAGTYASDQSVELSDSTSGAAIYYTLDGSAPTKSSNLYSGAIAVKGNGTNVTIKALAVKDGMTDSTIASAVYAISYLPQSLSLGALVGTWKQSVTIKDSEGIIGVFKCTLTIDAAGNFIDLMEIFPSVNEGTPSSGYMKKVGTLSVSENLITAIVAKRAYSNTPITSGSEPTWETVGVTRTEPALMVNGQLYWTNTEEGGPNCAIYKAKGAVSGIVGTWESNMIEEYGSSAWYNHLELIFQPDGSSKITSMGSNSPSYDGATVNTTISSYSTANGTLSLPSNGQTLTASCRIYGPNLVMKFSATGLQTEGYIKQ